jgi:hypothetical protein
MVTLSKKVATSTALLISHPVSHYVSLKYMCRGSCIRENGVFKVAVPFNIALNTADTKERQHQWIRTKNRVVAQARYVHLERHLARVYVNRVKSSSKVVNRKFRKIDRVVLVLSK